MSSIRQTYSDVPPSMDSEILSNIDALFEDAVMLKDDAMASTAAIDLIEVPSVEEVASLLGLCSESAMIEEGDDCDRSDEEATPKELSTSTPKIIARYAYPSESRTLAAPEPQPSTAQPQSSSPSLLDRIISYIASCIVSYIASYFEASPAIIEYTKKEIARKTKVRIEAQQVNHPSSTEDGNVIRLVALVQNGIWENGESKAAPVEIKAKHKRIREILNDTGIEYVAEELYAEEIRGAFQKLKGAGKEQVSGR
ncbi:Nn.00g075840.m01.CDS01 [Neocucurbitaria sp. VM-36]